MGWQSLVVYEEVAEEEGEDGTEDDTLAEDEEPAEEGQSEAIQEGTALLSKPMIYVSLGTPAPDTDLSDMSAAVIDTNSWSDFSGTAEQIVSAQQDMVRLRTRNSNQYMIRYVVPERSGTHELVLTSNTSGFNYALTTLLDLTLAAPEPFAQPMVEISGPGDAYLVGDVVSLEDATRLFPNTRWTTQEYGARLGNKACGIQTLW